ncbi:MAG TPA: FmdB family zinc ribbon protein [Anaerolineae bacterium]
MPTYTYRCSHCKHQFDLVQKFTDPPIERCPNCRRKTVHKVLHPASIQFKGSGWYITDSKGSSSPTSSSKPVKKKESSEPKSETPSSSGKDSD